MFEHTGGLAQLGEHLLCKQRVNGSIPLASTKFRNQIKTYWRVAPVDFNLIINMIKKFRSLKIEKK